MATCLRLQPGEICAPELLNSVCVLANETPAVLFCPDTEDENTTAPILAELDSGEYPRVVCQPCGGLTVEPDQDARQGHYTGLVRFGPNEMDDAINETLVSEYRIHFGDASGHILSEQAVASVNKTNETIVCCADIYAVQLTGALMPFDAAKLVVVTVDALGIEMPVGLSTPVLDYVLTTTTTTTPPPSCCATGTCVCTPQFAPSPPGAWNGGSGSNGDTDSIEEDSATGGRQRLSGLGRLVALLLPSALALTAVAAPAPAFGGPPRAAAACGGRGGAR